MIDLNYSPVLDYDEMEFVVPGPGARDGIRKCFGRTADGIEADIIRYMADHQEEHFARLGLHFGGLRGRRLQLIDCQNLFCEVESTPGWRTRILRGSAGAHGSSSLSARSRNRSRHGSRPNGASPDLTKPSPHCWPAATAMHATRVQHQLPNRPRPSDGTVSTVSCPTGSRRRVVIA